MQKSTIIEQIRQQLTQHSDIAVQQSGRRFFKEEIKIYGIKSPVVKKIAKQFFNLIKHHPKSEIFALCENLWQSGYIEESHIANHWSYCLNKQYQPDDFTQFEHWLNNYVSNWASCDTLCTHTIGDFVMMYPPILKNGRSLIIVGFAVLLLSR